MSSTSSGVKCCSHNVTPSFNPFAGRPDNSMTQVSPVALPHSLAWYPRMHSAVFQPREDAERAGHESDLGLVSNAWSRYLPLSGAGYFRAGAVAKIIRRALFVLNLRIHLSFSSASPSLSSVAQVNSRVPCALVSRGSPWRTSDKPYMSRHPT
jgi:hypothetical protein